MNIQLTQPVDDEKVKVAVKMEGSNIPFLGELGLSDQTKFMENLCKHWSLSNPKYYGLQFDDPPKHYVSSHNQSRIKNGSVLVLAQSARLLAENIAKHLANDTICQNPELMQLLARFSNDPLVADEFIELKGLQYLIIGIEQDKFGTKLRSNALVSFMELMDHGIIAWDSLGRTFLEKVVSFVCEQNQNDYTVLQTSLNILESAVLIGHEAYLLVNQNISLHHLLHHLTNCKPTRTSRPESSSSESEMDEQRRADIQQSVLALINALFQKTDAEKRGHFFTTLNYRKFRQDIKDNIFPSMQTEFLSNEMKHQLYVLQQLLFNQYEDRMNTPLDPKDQKAAQLIEELRSVAFEENRDQDSRIGTKEVTSRRMEIKKEFRKLGFKDDLRPATDFQETPPGMLALDNMVYFARNQPDQYSKLVLENCYRADSHECPFGRASIELTRLLCDILEIGSTPSEQGLDFHPMLFTHDRSFEELFCVSIILFNKTWKEMKATTEDFSKVVSVIKEQIIRTLETRPPSLDKFHERINALTYGDIVEIWHKERTYQEEQEMQAPPIMELKEQLKPEIMDLIQQHRLNFIMEGTCFKHKPSRSGKEKRFWYCRLSPNHKFLHYGDCDEKATPAIEQLTQKISIVDIKDLVTGKDVHPRKDKAGKRYASSWGFSLLLEDSSLDFVAPDEVTFKYWQDAINSLLRKRMQYSDNDMEQLLSMELKLRLLDTEGVPIPQRPPPIPPPPSNYDFLYQCN